MWRQKRCFYSHSNGLYEGYSTLHTNQYHVHEGTVATNIQYGMVPWWYFLFYIFLGNTHFHPPFHLCPPYHCSLPRSLPSPLLPLSTPLLLWCLSCVSAFAALTLLLLLLPLLPLLLLPSVPSLPMLPPRPFPPLRPPLLPLPAASHCCHLLSPIAVSHCCFPSLLPVAVVDVCRSLLLLLSVPVAAIAHHHCAATVKLPSLPSLPLPPKLLPIPLLCWHLCSVDAFAVMALLLGRRLCCIGTFAVLTPLLLLLLLLPSLLLLLLPLPPLLLPMLPLLLLIAVARCCCPLLWPAAVVSCCFCHWSLSPELLPVPIAAVTIAASNIKADLIAVIVYTASCCCCFHQFIN